MWAIHLQSLNRNKINNKEKNNSQNQTVRLLSRPPRQLQWGRLLANELVRASGLSRFASRPPQSPCKNGIGIINGGSKEWGQYFSPKSSPMLMNTTIRAQSLLLADFLNLNPNIQTRRQRGIDNKAIAEVIVCILLPPLFRIPEPPINIGCWLGTSFTINHYGWTVLAAHPLIIGEAV